MDINIDPKNAQYDPFPDSIGPYIGALLVGLSAPSHSSTTYAVLVNYSSKLSFMVSNVLQICPPDLRLCLIISGLYTTLFSICVHVLLRQRRNLHWIFPVFAFAMYSIATVDMLYTVVLCFRKLLKGTLSYQDLRPKYWLHVTNK